MSGRQIFIAAIVAAGVSAFAAGFATLYLVASTFTSAKTVRDEFEGQKLINKLAEARAEKLLDDQLHITH